MQTLFVPETIIKCRICTHVARRFTPTHLTSLFVSIYSVSTVPVKKWLDLLRNDIRICVRCSFEFWTLSLEF